MQLAKSNSTPGFFLHSITGRNRIFASLLLRRATFAASGILRRRDRLSAVNCCDAFQRSSLIFMGSTCPRRGYGSIQRNFIGFLLFRARYEVRARVYSLREYPNYSDGLWNPLGLATSFEIAKTAINRNCVDDSTLGAPWKLESAGFSGELNHKEHSC